MRSFMKKRFRGLTLVELLVTISLVAIITGLALPSFQNLIRKNEDREAFRILDVLRLEQKAYRANQNTYAPSGGGTLSGLTNINNIFQADLSAASYTVFLSSNGGYGSNAKFRAHVVTPSGNSWYVTQSMPEAVGSGTPPSYSSD